MGGHRATSNSTHSFLEFGDYGDEALDTIIQVMRKTRAGPGDATRLKAAMDVLDRIIGRPTQSLAASVIQRTVAADGTLIEGSAMISLCSRRRRLLRRRRDAATRGTQDRTRAGTIATPFAAGVHRATRIVVPSESVALESTAPPPSVQIPEVPEPAPELPHRSHRVLVYLPTPLPSWP